MPRNTKVSKKPTPATAYETSSEAPANPATHYAMSITAIGNIKTSIA